MVADIDFWALGSLVRVDRWMTDFTEPGDGRDWLVAVDFVFEGSGVVVEAVPDDDTISVHPAHGEPEHWRGESTRVSVSHPALGCGVRWAWSLTNHQGYVDGFQIEFASDQPGTHLQFVTVASRLVEFDLVTPQVSSRRRQANQ